MSITSTSSKKESHIACVIGENIHLLIVHKNKY